MTAPYKSIINIDIDNGHIDVCWFVDSNGIAIDVHIYITIREISGLVLRPLKSIKKLPDVVIVIKTICVEAV